MDYTTLTCCSLAFILYYNTLEAGFVYDDRRAILSNPDLLPTTSWRQLFDNDFWGTPLSDSGSHGSYRPLCVLSFRFNYMLNGFQPWGYHLVNVMLHCMATALLIRVARTILPKSRSFFVGPLATGLAFASHPIHTEAVAGIVGRADLAACNLYLLSFLIYVAHTKYRRLSCNNKIHHKSFTSDRQNPYNNGNGSGGSNSSSSGKQDDPLKQLHKFNSKIVTNFKTKLTNCSWPNGVIRREQCESLMSGQKKTRKHVHGTDDGNNVCCRLLLIKEWGCLFVCIMFAVAAMLSKETGVTVLGVCILYDILISTSTTNHNRRQWRSILVLMVAVTLMLLFRLQTRAPQFSTADNPTAKESKLLTRFLTFVYLPAFNFFLLVYPNVLSFDWGMDVIPRITTMQDPRNLLTVVFYLTLCLTVRQCIVNGIPSFVCGRRATVDVDDRIKKHCPCPVCHHSIADMQHSASCRSNNNNNSMNLHSSCLCLKLPKHVTFRHRTRMYNNNVASLLALGFLTIPFLPATNLFFYVGFVIAERVLYIPSVGLCLMIGLGAAKLWNFKRHRSVVCVSLFVLIVAFGGRTITRNRDWLDEESLYRSAIPVNSPKAFGNLGSVLSSQGRIVEAEWAFRQALLHRPNMADVHYNLGVLLQGKQQLNEAILSFQRAIHFRPSLALAYVNLGAALIAAGRCQEAVSVLRQGSRLDGTGLRDRREHETARVSALLQLGALYSDQGRLQRALAAYREAAHSLPEHYPPQSVFNVLGETLARLHQDEEAERWYQAALNAQPDHVPAHITYGKLLAKNISRIAEAEQWFRRAQRLAPDDPSVYHHYGEFLASRRRHKEAAVLYEKSAELRPNDYELAVAAATAMRQAGRYHDAERWYRKAVIIKPTDARGHTNLGAILHLNGKYMEAADSYREALRLQPNDVTTLTNLHKLHSVMT